jgi:2-oxoglutarate ferredoxin oxidoreductase subunit beta
MTHPSIDLLREDRLPHILCEGCGDGTIVNAMIQAIVELNLDLDNTVFVSGIGCSSRIPGYLKVDSLHTTHGRPIAFATGIKLAKPELKVIVMTGDGDMAAIGGNHFMHACRRNIDMLVICANNYIYGMTGGQHSPTTPKDAKTTTTPGGSAEPSLDIARVAVACGANYVCRWTTLHPDQIKESIKKGIEREGFSLIEVMSQCPTGYGRRNKMRTAIKMIEWMKENTIPLRKAEQLEKEGMHTSNKIVIGEFVDRKKIGLVRALKLVPEVKKEKIKKEEIKVRKLSKKEKEQLKKAREKIDRIIARLSSPKIRKCIEEEEGIRNAEKALLRRGKNAH